MFNVAEAVEAQITSVQVERVSALLAEGGVRTRQILSSGILAILGGVGDRASSPTGGQAIVEALRSPASGAGLFTSLLGEQGDLVVRTVSRTTGLTGDLAGTIVRILLPSVALVLGREVASRKLDGVGLEQLLHGAPEPVPARPTMAGTAPRPIAPSRPPPRSAKWLPLLLGAAAVALGATFLLRRAVAPRVEEPRAEAPLTEQEEQVPPVVPAPPLDTAGQTTLTGAEVTRELDELFADQDVPDRTTLTDVRFDTTAAVSYGQDTIARLATLMNQHPSTRVRIEAVVITGSTLGIDRAKAVRRILIDRGVDSDRIEVGPRTHRGDEDDQGDLDVVITAR